MLVLNKRKFPYKLKFSYLTIVFNWSLFRIVLNVCFVLLKYNCKYEKTLKTKIRLKFMIDE